MSHSFIKVIDSVMEFDNSQVYDIHVGDHHSTALYLLDFDVSEVHIATTNFTDISGPLMLVSESEIEFEEC